MDTARAREPLDALRERALQAPEAPAFQVALGQPGVAVIAEIKRASPSKGELAPNLDATSQARAYIDGGAAAVSVLTEPDRFKGSLSDLADVAALRLPTLRKDFVVDRYQIWESRAAGAAAVLLIVAALDEPDLAMLHDEALAAGLDVLVEVHDATEVAVAGRIGARIVGINARDLRSFEVDPDAFPRLRSQLPSDALAVAESGIGGPQDVVRAADQGADAVLVGETLVRAADPAVAVAELVAAGRMGGRQGSSSVASDTVHPRDALGPPRETGRAPAPPNHPNTVEPPAVDDLPTTEGP